jgi:hypothetical protein
LEKTISTITGLELKALLVQLASVPNICFRFRVVGEMWVKHLMHVISIKDHNVLLFDDKETKYYLVKINIIMQFEIDARFQNYQPFFHYTVKPSPELEPEA